MGARVARFASDARNAPRTAFLASKVLPALWNGNSPLWTRTQPLSNDLERCHTNVTKCCIFHSFRSLLGELMHEGDCWTRNSGEFPWEWPVRPAFTRRLKVRRDR